MIVDLTQSLVRSYINMKGQDLSDILRGGIEAYNDVVNLEVSIKEYDNKKKTFEEAKNERKGAQ